MTDRPKPQTINIEVCYLIFQKGEDKRATFTRLDHNLKEICKPSYEIILVDPDLQRKRTTTTKTQIFND